MIKKMKITDDEFKKYGKEIILTILLLNPDIPNYLTSQIERIIKTCFELQENSRQPLDFIYAILELERDGYVDKITEHITLDNDTLVTEENEMIESYYYFITDEGVAYLHKKAQKTNDRGKEFLSYLLKES